MQHKVLHLYKRNIMKVTVVYLFLLSALGLRLWAAKAYADFYDRLPEAEQKAILQHAMQNVI